MEGCGGVGRSGVPRLHYRQRRGGPQREVSPPSRAEEGGLAKGKASEAIFVRWEAPCGLGQVSEHWTGPPQERERE